MEISIAQNVAGQIQELLQISCFFCKLVCIFLAFFLHFNFSYKNGFAFFCIFLHYFCIFLHPDFWGPFFSSICFAFISSFMFPRKRQQPDRATVEVA